MAAEDALGQQFRKRRRITPASIQTVWGSAIPGSYGTDGDQGDDASDGDAGDAGDGDGGE